MLPIPTLYLRDPEDRRFVVPEVLAGCEWVLAGEGVPTRQYNGICVLFDPDLVNDLPGPVPELRDWWVRRVTRSGHTTPAGFVAITDPEPGTGRIVGWVPACQSSFEQILLQAVRQLPASDTPQPGTHELIGPRINRNADRVPRHTLIAHRDADIVDAPRTFDGLVPWLLDHPYKGVVWHHPDGRMVKLERKDVRRG